MTKKDTIEDYNAAMSDLDEGQNIHNLNEIRQKAWLNQFKNKNIIIHENVRRFLEKYKHAFVMFGEWMHKLLEDRDNREIISRYLSANKPKIYILKFYKYQFYYVMIERDKTIYIFEADDNNYIKKAKVKAK